MRGLRLSVLSRLGLPSTSAALWTQRGRAASGKVSPAPSSHDRAALTPTARPRTPETPTALLATAQTTAPATHGRHLGPIQVLLRS